MNLLMKILVGIGSSASIGFGIWHFFVPGLWKWYSYITPSATELIVAIRATNAFFSLSLVLFGIINILFVFGNHANRYSIIVMLAATSILWLTRVVFQLVLSTRVNQPASPIRDAGCLHYCFSMLHGFVNNFGDAIIRSLGNRCVYKQSEPISLL